MYELIAIGNALVDTEFKISDNTLTKTTLTKGNMTLTDNDGQAKLFDVLTNEGYTPAKKSGGGSAGNSVVAFSALGGQAFYNCRVGDDEMGKFYLSDLLQMGVQTAADKAIVSGTTGSCVVLVSEDGERTMQTNLAVSAEINEQNVDLNAIKAAKFLYLEGYLAMSPTALPAITALVHAAKANGTKIAVSFADPAVVKFAKDGVMAWLSLGVDMIFCNLDEAKIFADSDDADKAIETLLTHANLAVVTNGANPTTIAQKQNGDVSVIKCECVPTNVLDTNGAGDNFAGAFLYGLSKDLPLETCAKLASAVSSRVVSVFGARLDKDDYLGIKNTILG